MEKMGADAYYQELLDEKKRLDAKFAMLEEWRKNDKSNPVSKD